MPRVTETAITRAVLDAFRRLPPKAKPRTLPDGSKECTVLSGIVLSEQDKQSAVCVSLGTGMRCLPHSKLALANGVCLHDWHAEIVAIRAFNLFLLQECERIASNAEYASPFVRRRHNDEHSEHAQQPFGIREHVKIHMFSSEAPCGDASMELTMSAQKDATPWNMPAKQRQDELLGRGSFSQLGVVRRKPARADAPQSLSKSCTDKLAQRQCTSLLLSLTSSLVHPEHAYLDQLVIPESQHVPTAVQRSFAASGRMAPMVEARKHWRGGYTFCPFSVCSTPIEFEYCRPRDAASKSKGSEIAAMWTPEKTEVTFGGSIQGSKQFSPRGASAISRAMLWKKVVDLSSRLGFKSPVEQKGSYMKIKQDSRFEARRAVKSDVRRNALNPWPSNSGDDSFVLS